MCLSLTNLGCSTKSWRLAVVRWVNNTTAATQQTKTHKQIYKAHNTVTQEPITSVLYVCALLLASIKL